MADAPPTSGPRAPGPDLGVDLASIHELDGIAEDHVLNTELLNAELPDARFADASYLHWLYDLNPLGRGYYDNVDDVAEDGTSTRVAHYGLIPQTYRDAHETSPFVFSLNAVSRSGNQRRGFFTEIGRKIWGRAQQDGVRVVIGVTNANSTWPVRKAGWRVMGPMPVKFVLPSPFPDRNFTSYDVDDDFLDSDTFDALAEGLDESPAWHWTNCWTPEYLRWRLAAPNGARFSVHVSDELVAVSSPSSFRGVPVAVVLKLLPRHGRFGPIDAKPAVTAICHHHRAPFAVYSGHNRHVVVNGVRVPERFKPVPLNIVMLSLDDAIDQSTFQLDTFEFLDMDAY